MDSLDIKIPRRYFLDESQKAVFHALADLLLSPLSGSRLIRAEDLVEDYFLDKNSRLYAGNGVGTSDFYSRGLSKIAELFIKRTGQPPGDGNRESVKDFISEIRCQDGNSFSQFFISVVAQDLIAAYCSYPVIREKICFHVNFVGAID